MSSLLHGAHGVPITKEIAVELRQLVFGTAAAPPRGEWTRTGLTFNSPNQDLAYGLRNQRNGTRGLYTVIQGFIIKYLLFERRVHGKRPNAEELLRPNAQQQTEALLATMVEILMIIAEKSKVTIVLPGNEAYIPHSISYFQDSVTEKLHLYEMKKPDEILAFLRRNISHFTEDPGPGALLFLYSAVFTRTLAKVRTDLDGSKGSYLVGPLEEGSLNIVTLLLTGRATPYLHNGVVYAGDEQNYAAPQYGVLNRSALGLLLWEGDKRSYSGRQPGSRLKTPSLPIWVTLCGTHYGIVFNTNSDLLRNYHAESRFDLHYYNCSGCHVLVTVDNRHQHENASFMLQRKTVSSQNRDHPLQQRDDTGSTPLERLIHTKWEDASIKCQSQPITLSYLFNATS
ncbi:unnamed protein product [Hermetia illucens]|uniref:Ubiquitin carboxyl-terminal hydrolase MINDY n=1 Tax=Hermetia illucens TaxID=343691 RepID=A0A7R8UK98_HERIL|nr:inactive ubiquitin carboxyl-terminal hydrolase MINDY-4B [Hermetia illucens]CAD7081547.1 unnamed protein product [Hermetia illucens]